MQYEFWVLTRDEEETCIINILPGSDPLYGYGSWSIKAGPFTTYEEADKNR